MSERCRRELEGELRDCQTELDRVEARAASPNRRNGMQLVPYRADAAAENRGMHSNAGNTKSLAQLRADMAMLRKRQEPFLKASIAK